MSNLTAYWDASSRQVAINKGGNNYKAKPTNIGASWHVFGAHAEGNDTIVIIANSGGTSTGSKTKYIYKYGGSSSLMYKKSESA
tara:strand:- start:995 stop:1246 length:252 start_codon:yes stop_codon:yes gene_type:complete